jgi:hypothetical protein
VIRGTVATSGYRAAEAEAEVQELQMVVGPYWREWYRAQHNSFWATRTGDSFEAYVTSILTAFHPDFVNPEPAGNLGDRKCDGLAEAGKTFYACYGSRPEPGSTEAAIVSKITSDFEGAIEKWSSIEEWRFVTNARTGPDVGGLIITLQADHGEGSERPIRVRLWKDEHLWNEVISRLTEADLNNIYPGVPGVAHVELGDLLPLIDVLNDAPVPIDDAGVIREVPPNKMDFNRLSEARRIEMNSGRRLATRIDSWYESLADPDVADKQSARFQSIYREHAALHTEPDEIMEALYESLAGSGFRLDTRLANSVYAVTAYFFDSCHIFETPPVEGTADAAAD